MKVVLSFLLVALIGCGGGGGGGDNSVDVEGSRENPVSIGKEVPWADGTGIAVVSSTPDANDIVAAENEFNDPPLPGHQFFIARIRVTNSGTSMTDYAPSFDLRAIGSANVAYTEFGETSNCGVYPDSCSVIQLATGGSSECNLCWQILTEEANSMEMFRDYTQPLDETDEPLYWDLIP